MKVIDNKSMNKISKKMRILILELIYASKSSHIGSCFSMVEILVFIKIIIKKNDNVIVSKGHAAAAFYVFQYFLKKISFKDLRTFNLDNSYLPGHVTKNHVTKSDFSSGSLGHGLSVALGMAISNKFLKNDNKVYCILSDGELNEGSTLEAIYFAPSKKLSNLIVFLDYNKIQSYDFVKDVIDYGNLKNQLKLIGWNVLNIHNGNDLSDFLKIKKYYLRKKLEKPTFIICNTIKGYGIKDFENNNLWHYKNPNHDEYIKYKNELKNA